MGDGLCVSLGSPLWGVTYYDVPDEAKVKARYSSSFLNPTIRKR
jgi:hypothetical protein